MSPYSLSNVAFGSAPRSSSSRASSDDAKQEWHTYRIGAQPRGPPVAFGSPSQPRPSTRPAHGSRSISGRASSMRSARVRWFSVAADDERIGVRLGRGDERRPAGVAVLPRKDELRAGQDRLASAQSFERFGIAGTRGADELLRLLAELLQVHVDLPPTGPCPRLGRRRDRLVKRSFEEVGSALPADRVRPRARRASYCAATSRTYGLPRRVTAISSPAAARSMYQPKWLRNLCAPTEVEPRGIEPLTSAMPSRRSPS